MSYAFAGALKGLGGGVMKLAEEKRANAQRLLEMEKKAELSVEVAQSKADIKAAAKGGKGRGGSGQGRKGRGLTNQESDNLGRLYKSYVESGAFEGEPPSLGEFENRIELHIKDAGSLANAAEMARSEWGGNEVTTTSQHERAALSPARLWDDDGKYDVTTTETHYGFNSALGGADSASEASPASSRAPSQRAAAPEPSSKAEQAIIEARTAIAKGADRSAVVSRLQEMGVDPKGL